MTVHERERCAVHGKVEQREVTAAKRYQRRQVGQVAQKGNRRPVKGSNTAQFLEFLKRSGAPS